MATLKFDGPPTGAHETRNFYFATTDAEAKVNKDLVLKLNLLRPDDISDSPIYNSIVTCLNGIPPLLNGVIPYHLREFSELSHATVLDLYEKTILDRTIICLFAYITRPRQPTMGVVKIPNLWYESVLLVEDMRHFAMVLALIDGIKDCAGRFTEICCGLKEKITKAKDGPRYKILQANLDPHIESCGVISERASEMKRLLLVHKQDIEEGTCQMALQAPDGFFETFLDDIRNVFE